MSDLITATKSPLPTVGVIALGEMASTVASHLRTRGCRVLTSLDGRGGQTVDRARQCGVEVMQSFSDVVRHADIFISLVPPDAAESVASQYVQCSREQSKYKVYVDANSISPLTARRIAALVAESGAEFVDAAINGLAKNLLTTGTLFLSGSASDRVAQVFGDAVRTVNLGPEAGKASAMKMMLSSLAKGISGLFIETALLAERQDISADFYAACREIYPGLWALVERMVPTYSEHASRRAAEMAELKATADASDLKGPIVPAIHGLHVQLAAVAKAKGKGTTLESFLAQLNESGFLRGRGGTINDRASDPGAEGKHGK